MCNRIVDMLCMAMALNSGFAKIYFVKFLISPIRKNKVKYKFPGIRYNIIIVTNSLLFVKKDTNQCHIIISLNMAIYYCVGQKFCWG